MKRRHVILVVSAALLLHACGGSKNGDASGGVPESARGDGAPAADSSREVVMSLATIQHGGVRWQPAITRDVSIATEVPGQLVPNEDRTARLGAPARGRVVAVHVQVGSRVSAGQPL